MAHDESSLGALLRRFRLAAGLTQEELAGLSSLSVRTISYLETGHSAKPYRRSIQMLADALSLAPAERAPARRPAWPGGQPGCRRAATPRSRAGPAASPTALGHRSVRRP